MLLSRTAMFASPLGEKLELYAMSGREALSRPFVYEVELLSEDESLDLLALLGKPASVIWNGGPNGANGEPNGGPTNGANGANGANGGAHA